MPRQVLPAFDLFVDATFFWRCAALVGRHNYFYQAAALEAFSLELHLKCLHRISKRSIQEIRDFSHHIRKSFDALTVRDQREIKKRFAKMTPHRFDCMLSVNFGYKVDFDSVLDRAENLFVQARYRAEGKLNSRSRKKHGINSGISALIRTIHDLTFEKRPAWKNHPQLARHTSKPLP